MIHGQTVRTSSEVGALTPKGNFLCALHKALNLHIKSIDIKELHGFSKVYLAF